MNPASPSAGPHGRHDRLLVSRYAVDDAYPTEIAEARELVEQCPECARLADEIRLLRAATASVGAPVRARDFRLTPEQAERLRGSAVERVLRRLAAPGLAPLRPLAGVALSLGLALAVAGVVLPTPAADDFVLMGEPGAAEQQAPAGAPPAEGPAEGLPAMEATPAADNGSGEMPRQAADSPPPAAGEPIPAAAEHEEADREDAFERSAAVPPADELLRSILFYGGMGIALVSLGVLVLVIVARRRASDPLLR